MATFIISGSRGTDDPTMATLPFMAAKVAKEQGHCRACDGSQPDAIEGCLGRCAGCEYSHLGLRGLRRGTADRRRRSRFWRNDQRHGRLYQGRGRA